MFDFAMTDEQRSIVEVIRAFFEREPANRAGIGRRDRDQRDPCVAADDGAPSRRVAQQGRLPLARNDVLVNLAIIAMGVITAWTALG